MQVTETLSEGLKRELKVVIDMGDLDQRFSTKLAELKDRVQLKGFRPGKVPLAHLRKVYGRSVMAEIVQQAVTETSQQALTERDERPAFQPDISLTEDEKEIEQIMDGKADLAYTMAFEIMPEIEIADLSAVSVEKLVADVSQEDIDKGIEQLRENSTNYEAKDKDSPAELDDRVKIDFVGKIDGEAFEGGAATGADLVLGKGQFIPGFEEGLLGAKADEERVVEATFPEEYQVKELAGKVAQFETKVIEVAAPKLPEINDEFAKTLGLEDLSKLQDAIKEQIASEYENASKMKVKRELLDKLDEDHKFELPPTLVDNEFEAVWGQITQEMERSNRSFEDEETSEEDARKEYRKIAERRVRLALVLSEIGEKNEIKVSDEDVNRALMQRVQQFPGQEKQVFEYYQQNQQALAELRGPIFEEKVVDFILELAKVTEKKVSIEELMKAGAEEEGESADSAKDDDKAE